MEERQVFWKEDELKHRLRRIEGQIRGIGAMIDRQESCHAILMQVAAVRGALDKIAKIIEACSVAEGLLGLPGEDLSDRARVQAVLSRVVEGKEPSS
ncbi:MAG: metal-sensitive transcriptional regulator [Firmicutes bacterium]|nr:metal-sensitive transcriptional regulator [Alicyclobacillaceae bacterium]MCL6496066.1 metal-sensitive transcriptional regulator [Bacillota bacterium]